MYFSTAYMFTSAGVICINICPLSKSRPSQFSSGSWNVKVNFSRHVTLDVNVRLQKGRFDDEDAHHKINI